MKNFIKYRLRLKLNETISGYGDDYDFSKHNFNFGDCDIYAVSLHRLYGYPLYVIRGYFLEEEWGGEREWDYEDCHIMVKLPNGNYMDSSGEATGNEMKRACLFGNKIEKIKILPIDEQTALSTFSCQDQEESIKQVMKYISKKNKINESYSGLDKNKLNESICNVMSVRSYDEVMGRLIAAIGRKDENPDMWEKIEKPLKMLKQACTQINKEKYTSNDGKKLNKPYGMTGDSIPDEANTYWSSIQTTICQ